MNLLLLEPGEIDAGVVRLHDGRAAHLRTVLAVVPGQTVRVGVIEGPIGVGTVTAVSPETVALACTFAEVPPRPAVDLLLALPRPKVLQRLWAQCAALGVGRIVLTNAAKVERPYFDTHVLDPATYRALLLDGLQQARDTRVPVVSVHRQFRPLIEDHLDTLCPRGLRIVADPSAEASVSAVVAGVAPGAPDDGRVVLAVGPEGGWNSFELDLLAQHGFVRATLGERTLRSDTACIALLAVVHEGVRIRAVRR